jgi:hypothetical protein
MLKAKITMTIEAEYPINPQQYRNALTAEECVWIDVQSLYHNLSSIFAIGSATVSVTGKLLLDEPEDENQLSLSIEGGSFVAPKVTE